VKELPFDMSAKVEELIKLIAEGKERVAKACHELGYTDLYISFEEGSNETGTQHKPATLKTADGLCLAQWWLQYPDADRFEPEVIRFIVQPLIRDVADKLAELPKE
jgi:hypothetical protein